MNLPICIFNRLVVNAAYRNRGLAERLDMERIKYSRMIKVNEIWIESRKGNRFEKLQQQGFEIQGVSTDLSVPGDWFILKKCLV